MCNNNIYEHSNKTKATRSLVRIFHDYMRFREKRLTGWNKREFFHYIDVVINSFEMLLNAVYSRMRKNVFTIVIVYFAIG